MKRVCSMLAVTFVSALLLSAHQGFTQDAKPGAKTEGKATAKVQAAGAKPTADAEKPKGRVPNNYGKIGLSEEQRTKILSIQAKLDGEIDKLEAQIAQLKAQKEKEVEAVLTAEQKTKLAELTAATAKKKSDAKAKPKEEPKKEDK